MVRENRVSGSCRGKSEVVIAANDGGYGLLHSAAARFGQLSDLLRPMLTVARCRVTSSQQMRLTLSGPVCRACATTSGRWGKWKMESMNSAWGALRGTCFALPLTPNDSSRLCGSSCAPHRRAGWTDARLSPDDLFDLFADSTRVSPGWQFGNGTPSCLLIPDGPSFSLRFSNPAPAPRRLLPVGPASLPRKAQPGNRRPKLLWLVPGSSWSSPQPACKGQAAPRQGHTGRGRGVLDPIPALWYVLCAMRGRQRFHVWGNGLRRGSWMPRAHEI